MLGNHRKLGQQWLEIKTKIKETWWVFLLECSSTQWTQMFFFLFHCNCSAFTAKNNYECLPSFTFFSHIFPSNWAPRVQTDQVFPTVSEVKVMELLTHKCEGFEVSCSGRPRKMERYKLMWTSCYINVERDKNREKTKTFLNKPLNFTRKNETMFVFSLQCYRWYLLVLWHFMLWYLHT